MLPICQNFNKHFHSKEFPFFQDYESGKMLTNELKAITIAELQKLLAEIQENRRMVTDADVEEFMRPRPLKYKF